MAIMGGIGAPDIEVIVEDSQLGGKSESESERERTPTENQIQEEERPIINPKRGVVAISLEAEIDMGGV